MDADDSPGPMDLFMKQSQNVTPADESSVSGQEESSIPYQLAQDKELTLRYLNGEVTFEELSKVLEESDEDEEDVTESHSEVVTALEEPSTSKKEDVVRMKKGRKKGPRSRLPKDMFGLMGEANLQFARGNMEEAIKMCMEVIRLVPNAPEPFQTMSMICEEQGNSEKALQYGLIAAHLNTRNVSCEEWHSLADMCIQQKHLLQALKCYDHALRGDKENIGILMGKFRVYELLGNARELSKVHDLIRKTKGNDSYLFLTKQVAKNYHKDGNTQKAIEVMTEAMEWYPSSVTSEDVNLTVELNMATRDYKNAMKVLVTHCGVKFKYEDKKTLSDGVEGLQLDEGVPTSIVVPESLPVDLQAKLVVLLIHITYLDLVPPLLSLITSRGPDEVGDLYLDIAEVYMEKGCYGDAVSLLEMLITSTRYGHLAAIWLRYAECLSALGKLTQAADAYKKVVELAPSHMGARVSFAHMKQRLGKPEEALQVLSEQTGDIDTEVNIEDSRIYLHRCLIMLSQERYVDAYQCLRSLMFSHFHILKKETMNGLLRTATHRSRCEYLSSMYPKEWISKYIKENPLFKGGPVSQDDLWEIFIKVVNGLCDDKNYGDLIELLAMGLTVQPFSDSQKQQTMTWLVLHCLVMNKDGEEAYYIIRDFLFKNIKNNGAWNLLCHVQSLMRSQRHNRFLIRLLATHPDSFQLVVMNANNSLTFGNYKVALGDYVHAWSMLPKDPYVNLMIGLNFIHMSCQKSAVQRHSLVAQGISFLNRYVNFRGKCQEVYFNLGRAMQQLGLSHAAIHYYEKVFTMESCISGEEKELFDLKCEAAFNLSLIYRKSDSPLLAQAVLQKYLVI